VESRNQTKHNRIRRHRERVEQSRPLVHNGGKRMEFKHKKGGKDE